LDSYLVNIIVYIQWLIHSKEYCICCQSNFRDILHHVYLVKY